MQRVDGRDHRLLGRRPARRIGSAQHGGADLLLRQMRGPAKVATCTPHSYSQPVSAQVRSMTISRSRSESGPRSKQAAGAEFFPGPRAARHDAKQHQRRRAAHDAVELLLDFRRIRRLERRDA